MVRLFDREFFVRDRKVESLEVPYKQRSADDFEELLHMAKAHMIWLGTFHARQLTDGNDKRRKAYVQAFVDSGERLTSALYDFNLRYLNSFGVNLPGPTR